MRAYHAERGEHAKRTRILVPDSAHGTNPASTTMAGLEVVEIPSDARGNVDLVAAAGAAWTTGWPVSCSPTPTRSGLFEENLLEVTRLVHEAGGLVYGDGANFNAILGVAQAGPDGHRRHALQPAQDLLHAARRRRTGVGRGGCGRGARRVPARARGGADGRRARTPRYEWRMPAQIHRQGEELPRQLRRAGARVHLHPHARARRASAPWRRTRCSTPTTCRRG